jgi:GT2 family glycosyltransferase
MTDTDQENTRREGTPADKAPLLSCIVPLFNHLELSQAMLASLRAGLPAGLSHEIILVDDGSTDGTREWLAGLSFPGLTVLLNERNLGFAGSNNRGARQARGRFLALLNNDLLLGPGWLEPMLALYQKRGDKIGVVGNLQLRVSDGLLDHAGIRATRDAKLVHIRRHPPAAAAGIPVLAVTAACCLLRREDFLSVGGFDEGYVNGGEDVDLCLALGARGLRSFVAPASVVRHHVSATRATSSLQDERNSRRLFSKWPAELGLAVARAWCETGSELPRPSLQQRLFARLFRMGLLTKPPRRAILLAQSALRRETLRWAQLLDGTPPPECRLLRAEGLHWDAASSPAWIGGRARFILDAGTPLRNLFLAGHLSPPENPERNSQPLGLRVCVNGLRAQEHFPIPHGNFNLGLDAPCALPDRETVVELELVGEHPWSPLAAALISLSFLPKEFRRRLRQHSLPHDGRRLRLRSLVADDRVIADFSTAPVQVKA